MVIVAGLIVSAILLALLLRVARLEARIVSLEARLERIAPLGDCASENSVSERVAELAKQGDRVGAIKEFRAKTGADLATAIRAVEPLLRK